MLVAPFPLLRTPNTVHKGLLDAAGYARIGAAAPGTAVKIEYLRNTLPAESHVDSEFDGLDDFYKTEIAADAQQNDDTEGGKS